MPNLHAHKFIRNEKVINAHTKKKHSANVKTVKTFFFLCVCVCDVLLHFSCVELEKAHGCFYARGNIFVYYYCSRAFITFDKIED